jgi:DNA invertase Pin-like site-specific DNA recombinase
LNRVGAVIYCRVSTAEQTQNLSLPTQEARCREYCERLGLTVDRVFVERGESAKTANRPELQNLLRYCREQKRRISAVIVYALNRFSRDSREHHVLRGLLLGLGISIRSATEPIDETPTGKLMESLFAALAQWDNDERARRTVDGMTETIRRGRFPFQAPVGYRNGLPGSGEPSLVPDREQAPLVAQAFDLYANTGASKNDVLRTITTLGLKTRHGRAVTPQTLDRMLRNPVYCGRIVVRKWKLDVRGDFSPIVSEVVFRHVQARLSGKSSSKPRKMLREDFPLRRFVRCAACDRKLTGSWSTGRRGRRYAYYHCPDCRVVKVKKAELEDRFLALLNALRPKPSFVRLFHEIVVDVWKQVNKLTKEGRVPSSGVTPRVSNFVQV